MHKAHISFFMCYTISGELVSFQTIKKLKEGIKF